MSAEQTTLGADTGATPGPDSPTPAGAAPDVATGSPGARLRAAREARQLGVQQVTDLLHIEPRLIAAMEADDFAAFDAPVYARGFLRKYASFLDVPAAEIVAGYERLHSGPGTPSFIPPATAEEPRRDWSALKVPVTIAGMLVLVAGSYWWWLTRGPLSAPEPERAVITAPATTAPAEPLAGPPGADEAAGGEVASVDAPAGSSAGMGVASSPAGAAATLAPPPSLPSGAALVIDFVGECWVEVIGPTGDRLMYDLGRAGESRALPGPGPWRVYLGAADSARLRVSGRPVTVPPASRSGATARLVVGPDGTVQ